MMSFDGQLSVQSKYGLISFMQKLYISEILAFIATEFVSSLSRSEDNTFKYDFVFGLLT